MPGATTAFQTGIHASRPAASAGCIHYSCTTHSLVYQSDGSTWTTWATLGGSTVDDATISTTDITTNNASTSKHGWLKKLDNNAAHFMDGTGAWTAPSGTPAFVGCRVFNSGNFALTSGSVTQVTFDSERFDTSTFHSTSSNQGRLVAPTTGYYSVGCTFNFAANATGYREVRIRLNGSTLIGYATMPSNTTGRDTGINVNTSYALTAADYVDFAALQNSGGSLNINADANDSPEAWMYFLGA